MDELFNNLTSRAKEVIEENRLTTDILYKLNENDINDLFSSCTFMDRFHLRHLQSSQNQKSSSVESSSSMDLAEARNQDTPSCSSVDNIDKASSASDIEKESFRFSVESMLSKKERRGKALPAQKHFAGLIRDAANAAHLWKKAPRETDISERKKDVFLETVFEQEPRLKQKKREVWKALCAQLRNRRKYLNDLACQKRGRKGEKRPIATGNLDHGNGAPASYSPSGNGILPGTPVHIKDGKNVIIGKGSFLSKKNNIYGEIVVRAVNKLDNYNEVELPEPVDGQTIFNEKLIKKLILWKLERIEKELPKGNTSRSSIATSPKSTSTSTSTTSMVQTKLHVVPVNTKLAESKKSKSMPRSSKSTPEFSQSKSEASNVKPSRKLKVTEKSTLRLPAKSQNRPIVISTVRHFDTSDSESDQDATSPKSTSTSTSTSMGQTKLHVVPVNTKLPESKKSKSMPGSSKSTPEFSQSNSEASNVKPSRKLKVTEKSTLRLPAKSQNRPIVISTVEHFNTSDSESDQDAKSNHDSSNSRMSKTVSRQSDYRIFVLMEWSKGQVYWGLYKTVDLTNDYLIRNCVKPCFKFFTEDKNMESAELIIYKNTQYSRISPTDCEINPNMEYCICKIPMENSFMKLVAGGRYGTIEVIHKESFLKNVKEGLDSYM